MIKYINLTLCLLLLSLTTIAHACDCRIGSLEERIASSDIVLVARIISYEPLHQVRVKRVEIFKGQSEATFAIPVGLSDCDLFLPPLVPHKGDEYLLYLGNLEGRIYASRCQHSGLVHERKAELQLLKKRLRSEKTRP